ncbi:nitroreductase family deazaflavin-dependent oxidoreductase [Mycolicibacterium arabiense]|uniref:nitroreductase family deazaflavin-dependent oxidoreductase n=1 Tax=Mycolicibacterium arabiense TaxID=1286181 RepID=UPI0013D5FDB5|nr:nitroreductase family deazaflavin-dependent oxidoreductase [Mycolicibacterium arabiense]MCV7372189.1 nitroreductase family deazaflavin-dependent oxidoreductase [Mycolicibacterium arabiense]
MTVLPDEGWIYAQNQELEKLNCSGTTDSLALTVDGEEKQVIVVTVRGAKTGQPRRIPLMRVEHNGHYAAVASKGGYATPPAWYHNFKANPAVQLQDGMTIGNFMAREIVGEERSLWWGRAVQAFGPYEDYAEKAARQIPVFVLEPAD